MINLHGTGVALVTPFLADGTVDTAGLAKITKHVMQGVDYIRKEFLCTSRGTNSCFNGFLVQSGDQSRTKSPIHNH